MRRSRRMAAAVSALAMAAGGLVSAAVIGVGPARADICDSAEATQSPQPPQGQQPDQNQPDQNQPDQNQPDQDQPDQDQGRQPDGRDSGRGFDRDADRDVDRDFDGQAPQGGGVAVDPRRSPDGPQTESPDGQAPATQAPDGQNPDGQSPDGQVPDGQNPDGQNPDGQNPEVEAPGDAPEADGRRRGGGNPTPAPSPSPTQDPDGTPQPSPTATGGAGDECAIGPFADDFVDIRQVAPSRLDARIGRNGSRGTFVAQCGTNQNGHHNSDNFIVAPGVSNGAHHLHDYVGNLSTDAFSTDESLEAADTTCRQGDKSTYFWPVLRDRTSDANAGDPDGNVGQILRPRSVRLEFRGNPASEVVAMPRFLRLITGDAKAATNGGAEARAAWTCSGFQNRISPDKYPLCPRGSQVVRILDFPSCWDGQNTDSANHRTHVVFPDQGGACPQGTRAIPRLRMTLTYSVPQGRSYALDAFPEQKHNPVTDHGDFANVMPERLMQSVVSCINRGRRC
ncbi:DUF1996 domain-containing protein [Nonomuraea terrae]|nr:DUF1996 domain-containing protein [Nonomuraea terrae]